MLRRMTEQHVGLDGELFAKNSSALKKRVKRVKAYKAPPQDFLVRQPFFGATFQDAIDADAFNSLKLVVLQIGIVNHLADFLNCFVSNREALRKRFEIAIAADMRNFGVDQVD